MTVVDDRLVSLLEERLDALLAAGRPGTITPEAEAEQSSP